MTEPSIADKVAYVKAQRAHDGKHECHWPGCPARVPPAKWGCATHWFRLPRELRNLIWRCYRPGQEIDKRPSTEYLQVAHRVQAWIAEQPKP